MRQLVDAELHRARPTHGVEMRDGFQSVRVRGLDAARELLLAQPRVELGVRHAEIVLPRHLELPLGVVARIVWEESG